MPSNRHGGQYGEFERYETARNHMEREQGGHGEQRREGNAKFMKSQYDDLVAAGHENEHDDLRPAVCNKCFRENVVRIFADSNKLLLFNLRSRSPC